MDTEQFNQLLTEVREIRILIRIGNRDYYDREDVYELLRRRKEERITYKLMALKAMAA